MVERLFDGRKYKKVCLKEINSKSSKSVDILRKAVERMFGAEIRRTILHCCLHVLFIICQVLYMCSFFATLFIIFMHRRMADAELYLISYFGSKRLHKYIRIILLFVFRVLSRIAGIRMAGVDTSTWKRKLIQMFHFSRLDFTFLSFLKSVVLLQQTWQNHKSNKNLKSRRRTTPKSFQTTNITSMYVFILFWYFVLILQYFINKLIYPYPLHKWKIVIFTVYNISRKIRHLTRRNGRACVWSLTKKVK